MNRDLENRIYRIVDGECDGDELERHTAELEASAPARERLEYERDLRTLVGSACRDEASAEVKARLMDGLRAAIRESDAAPITPLRRFRWEVFALPAVAACIAGLLWAVGVFDPEPEPTRASPRAQHVPHDPIVDKILTAEWSFLRRVGFGPWNDGSPEPDIARIRAESSDTLYWSRGETCSSDKRFKDCCKLAEKATGHELEMPLPPADFEPRAFRVAQLQIDGNTVDISKVPHMVLDRGGKQQLSIYQLSGASAKALGERLKGAVDIQARECPECGVLFRSWGEGNILVFVSRMPFSDLRSLARDI